MSVAYPVLDFILLLPLALLLRIALRLRGGEVEYVWLTLFSGFLLLCLGDILFAHFQALGQQHLDSLVDAVYILSYGLVAAGVSRQHRLLAG